jgi:hypothetical protein
MRRVLRISRKILLIVLILVGCAFFFVNLPGPKPREDVRLGMTFSSRYASDLGLDWRETYLALLDEMGVRHMRLPVYWDLIEPEPGQTNYADLDWQVEEARSRGVELILTVGQRVPRWPECHIPGWAGDTETRQRALLRFIDETVRRYQDNPAVVSWQVENEPFLSQFGVCPPLDVNFLESEIALVKAIDKTRPVIVTDSGELSLWFRAASRGDIFGTTLYRHIYKEGLGYVTYPIGPNFFRAKEALVRLLTHQENFMVIELQAEPWARGWVLGVPVSEQYRTMNADILRQNVDYARRLGFRDIYLWGGEWWYWLLVKADEPEVWRTGQELFSRYGG